MTHTLAIPGPRGNFGDTAGWLRACANLALGWKAPQGVQCSNSSLWSPSTATQVNGFPVQLPEGAGIFNHMPWRKNDTCPKNQLLQGSGVTVDMSVFMYMNRKDQVPGTAGGVCACAFSRPDAHGVCRYIHQQRNYVPEKNVVGPHTNRCGTVDLQQLCSGPRWCYLLS